jgi:flagellar protein FlaG
MNVETVRQLAIVPHAAADTAQAQSGKVAQQPQVAAPAPASEPAVHQPVAAPTFDAVKAAAKQIDSYLKSVGRNLDIHVDRDTGRTIVQVRDAETGDVIRQIPNEETLRLARSLGESGAAIVDLTV